MSDLDQNETKQKRSPLSNVAHPPPLQLDEVREVISCALQDAGLSPTAVHLLVRPDYAYVHTAVAGMSAATQDELVPGHSYLVVGVNDHLSGEQGFSPDIRRPQSNGLDK